MSQNDGYAGKILSVDLSTGAVTNIRTSDYSARFLGGRGIAAKVYWDEMSPQAGPLTLKTASCFLPARWLGSPRWLALVGRSAGNRRLQSERASATATWVATGEHTSSSLAMTASSFMGNHLSRSIYWFRMALSR